MAYSRKEDQAAYARVHYLNNKEKVKARAVIHRNKAIERNKEYVNSLKEAAGCIDCGGKYPHYVLQFDHIGSDKLYNISNLVRNACSLGKIQLEIQKCEVVCANCHCIRTHQRRMQGSLQDPRAG